MNKKWLMTVMTMTLMFGATQMTLAREGGASGARAGGMSSEHMSAKGEDNSNAQNRGDATRGMDRAQERMSEQGKAHEKATKKKKVKSRKTHKEKNMNQEMNMNQEKEQETEKNKN